MEIEVVTAINIRINILLCTAPIDLVFTYRNFKTINVISVT